MLISVEDFHTHVSSSPMCELMLALQPDSECFCCTKWHEKGGSKVDVCNRIGHWGSASQWVASF